MRTLFICGTLEEGRDGVGDYSRRLAGELIRQGHQATIVSLNDKYVTHRFEGIQKDIDINVPTIRLPSILSWRVRIRQANQAVSVADPEWISLQYVPYSFQTKGLPLQLGKRLEKIGGERNWHIMFHELWVGIKKDSPCQHFFYKHFQKQSIKKLVRNLRPSILHTSNAIYQQELKTIGLKSDILPLFSNIPFIKLDDPLFSKLLNRMGISKATLSSFYIVGAFGSLYDDVNLTEIIEMLLSTIKDRQLFFVSFGKTNNDNMLTQLEETFKDRVQFARLGVLPEKEISGILQILNKGVCCTPEEYITKSGVYAAMMRHQLPVISQSTMKIPQYENTIKNFNQCLKNQPCEHWDVKFIAQKFYESICLHSDL